MDEGIFVILLYFAGTVVLPSPSHVCLSTLVKRNKDLSISSEVTLVLDIPNAK